MVDYRYGILDQRVPPFEWHLSVPDHLPADSITLIANDQIVSEANGCYVDLARLARVDSVRPLMAGQRRTGV